MSSNSIIETHLNDIKERLSLGVVTTVAARAGCEISGVNVDRNGVDVTIKPIKGEPVYLDAQLKSSSILERKNGHLIYDIPVKNYNELRRDVVGVSRILLILDLESDENQWWESTATAMTSRRNMFWYDLRGMPSVKSTNKTRLKIPITQRFTPDELIRIIHNTYNNLKVGKGGMS